MEAEVVQFTQEVLAQHVHVGNGAGHRTPNHGTVSDPPPQHHFPNGSAQYDLRQRIHGAKVGQCSCVKRGQGHNSCESSHCTFDLT